MTVRITARVLRDERSPATPLPLARERFASTVRLVHAERLAAATEAKRILDAARGEAAAIVARAESDARADAANARTEALDAARLESFALVARARDEESRVIDAATEVVVQATRAVAERALGERLALDDATLAAWAREGLLPLRGARRIVLRGQALTLERLQSRLRELAPRGCDLVEPVLDDALPAGVLHARSELGEVRLEVRTQVDSLVEVVRDAIAGAVRSAHG